MQVLVGARNGVLVAAFAVFLASGAFADDVEFEPVDLPPDLHKIVAGLPQEKIDYLRGEGVLGYAERHEILFELVEVNPLVDPGYTTAQNATRVLRECLNGLALRKRGLTEEHYLSPLTTDHAQKD